MSFNLPLEPSDFHLHHVSLSKNSSLHAISNLILLSHLSGFFFFFDHQIPWESDHFHVPLPILFPNFFQSERACSIQLNHPIQSPRKPQISSGITQFNYFISSDMVHAPSVFQFSLPLTSLILHDIFFLFSQAIFFFLLFISYFLSLFPVT